MLKTLYYRLHKRISRRGERGEYSSGYWQNIIRDRALEMCRGREGNFLEVGCGEGLFLVRLANGNQFLSISGVDIWRDILLKAEMRMEKDNIKNVKLVNARGSKLPFKSNYFDAVICINVFFNLPSERMVFATLEEIIRVCKKGGEIIFDIRNSLNPLLFFKYKLARYYDETVRALPLKTYRITRLIPFLKGHGLEIVNKIYTGFPYNRFAPIIILKARKRC